MKSSLSGIMKEIYNFNGASRLHTNHKTAGLSDILAMKTILAYGQST
jgi:hypothetical protein